MRIRPIHMLWALGSLVLLPGILGCSQTEKPSPQPVEDVEVSPVDTIASDAIWQLACNKATHTLTHFTVEAGSLHGYDSLHTQPVFVPPHVWTSGFWPALLWQLYAHEETDTLKQAALTGMKPLANQRHNASTHDLGFMLGLPFGHPQALQASSEHKRMLIEAAYTLAGRFNPKVGMLQSWPANAQWSFPVIVDNLMNLNLLLQAADLAGDSSLYQIAYLHGRRTLQYHQRPDGSHIHLVNFSPISGRPISKINKQGLNDSSCWARGQAWAIYGYTRLWQHSRDSLFLSSARKSAIYFKDHLPDDGFPFWDLALPSTQHEPRDASAAAIAASAFLQLALAEVDKELASKWHYMGYDLLRKLASPTFLNKDASFPFLLTHATGNRLMNHELDASLIYADYYFLEALSLLQASSHRLEDIP